MVETRALKANRDLPIESDKCRICRQTKETVMHWLSGCTRLAATEYLKRRNNALCVALGIQEGRLGKNMKWCKEGWNKGTVIENDECKLCWDFEYNLRKITTRRPDVTIEYKDKNKIFLAEMACPSENNVDAKHAEKLQKYQQLAFETRDRRPGYNFMIILIVIGCLGRGMRRVANQIGRLISDEKKTRVISNKMVKTVLFEESDVLSGLMQEE